LLLFRAKGRVGCVFFTVLMLLGADVVVGIGGVFAVRFVGK